MRRQQVPGRILPIGVLAALAGLVVLTPISSRGVSGDEATFCLGFLLIFAFFLARALATLRLPEITGYIVAGVLCGPFVLNILSTDVVRSLQIFDDVALSIIALIAGGEMRMSFLRKSRAAVASVIAGQVSFSFIAALIVVYLLRNQIGMLDGMGAGQVVAVALLFGMITAARSPSTTIGVITEARARGPFTNLTIGVTVILDVVVLLMVALILPAAESLVSVTHAFHLGLAVEVGLEVVGSLVVGVAFGFLIGAYIRWVGEQLPIFLVGAGFIGSMVCRLLHLEPLLAFMIAGFIVQNYTVQGGKLISALERSALPVYVVFFAISGASIDLDALRATWLLALVLVVVRAAAFWTGTMAAASLVPAVRPFSKTLWLGLLSQAGVTIGIASIIERTFDFGGELKTIVLAVVAINQIVGPIALKYILVKNGEAGGMDRRQPPSD